MTAADIIATAKQALAKDFPGRAFEKMDREELVAMLQVQGMKALDAQVEEFRAEVDGKVGAVEKKVDQLARDLAAIKGILERLARK